MTPDAASPADTTWTPADLQERLSDLSRRKVMLMITDNTTSMLHYRPDGDGILLVRAHKMFLQAPEPVVHAMSRMICGQKLRRDVVQEFINDNTHRIRPRDRQERERTLRTDGKHHDLAALHAHVNETCLDGRSTAAVTWGRKPSKRRAQRIQLGSYDPAAHLITISRRLDKRDIPRYMVEYVLYHEMLHEVLGIGERPDGKRDIHGKTFRLLEQTYPYYTQAKRFEQKHWGG